MDPFRIEEPFVVSFSGGRTSGYMLRKALISLTHHALRQPKRFFGKIVKCT